MRKVIIVLAAWLLYVLASLFNSTPDNVLGVSLGDKFVDAVKAVESDRGIKFEITEIDDCRIRAFYKSDSERVHYVAADGNVASMYHIKYHFVDFFPDSMEYKIKVLRQHGLPNGLFGLASLVLNMFSGYDSGSGVMFTYEKGDSVYRVAAARLGDVISESKTLFRDDEYYRSNNTCLY